MRSCGPRRLLSGDPRADLAASLVKLPELIRYRRALNALIGDHAVRLTTPTTMTSPTVNTHGGGHRHRCKRRAASRQISAERNNLPRADACPTALGDTDTLRTLQGRKPTLIYVDSNYPALRAANATALRPYPQGASNHVALGRGHDLAREPQKLCRR